MASIRRVGLLATLLPLFTLLVEPAKAGGLQGRVQSRLQETVRQENITDGFRDMRVVSTSTSNWNGEMSSAQASSDVTLKMLGLSMQNVDSQSLDETRNTEQMNTDSYSGIASFDTYDGMALANPVIRLLTSEGANTTRITASGSDMTSTDARMVDRFNSTSYTREEGADSSSFGSTF